LALTEEEAMNVLLVLAVAVIAFLLASRFYSRYLAKRLGEDPGRPTPAVVCSDGRDFVPTKPYIVFAHHFSAIAGAGPILGPTMAILYGFGPAWLWVVLGGIFFGAVHDYTALFVSIREGGRSMAEVARKTLGNAGFNLFISFTIIMIVLVTSSFLSATAISLTSLWPLAKIGVKEGETFLKTVVRDGVVMGRIGGIASTSVIFITLCSPGLGFLIYKKGLKTLPSYVLALAICVVSVILGIAFPVTLAPTTWMIIISVYVLIAAGVPVWAILQPRDFINVQILYGGIILMVLSLFSTGFQGVSDGPGRKPGRGRQKSGLHLADDVHHHQPAGPFRLSFPRRRRHNLQAADQRDRCAPDRYNAMLLESVLAVCVLLALGAAMSFTDYKSVVWPPTRRQTNPILGFSLAAALFPPRAGHSRGPGDGFSASSSSRASSSQRSMRPSLNRYLFEELGDRPKRTPRFSSSTGSIPDCPSS
jgi:carbon starvation protein